MEDKAMELEVSLALRQFLLKKLGRSVTHKPHVVLDNFGRPAQEWDGAFESENVLYLCEAKHVMSLKHVENFPNRLEIFVNLMPKAQPEYSAAKFKKIVGVACGTWFPPDVRKEAHRLGLLCVYPSGLRYAADKDPPASFEIET